MNLLLFFLNKKITETRLIDWFSSLEDKNILEKIDSFRKMNNSGRENLSYEDQRDIDEGLNQLNEGNWNFYSEVRKEIESSIKFSSYTSPEKPMKAIANIPAAIKAIGVPFNPFGTSCKSKCSLMPAKSTSASPKPTAFATA